MQLLVYVRNHHHGGHGGHLDHVDDVDDVDDVDHVGHGSGPGPSGRPAGPSRSGRSYVGIAVGEAPRVETLPDDAPTSYVEVRLRADAVDPATEITLLVAKALATQGLPGGFRELEYDGLRGSVRLLPEPGFDTTRAICRAILPVLQRCRVHRGTVTTSTAATA